MLSYNINVADGLANGVTGTVVGFQKEKGQVNYVLVQFDDPNAGQEHRKKYASLPGGRHLPNVTPIGKASFQYQLGKAERHDSTRAKVMQFPLTLSWAITVHKSQGQTIKPPVSLVGDMDSLFGACQAYVMLGRIQSLDQLYLLSFNAAKIMTNAKALQEVQKIETEALNSPKNLLKDIWKLPNSFHLKIASLNIR